MSDRTFAVLVEAAFFISILLVGVWLQINRKPAWMRVIGVVLTIVAFGFGIVSVVRLLDQLVLKDGP